MIYPLSIPFRCIYMFPKLTLPNIRKGLIKLTCPLHLKYVNDCLLKSFSSLRVIFAQCNILIDWLN